MLTVKHKRAGRIAVFAVTVLLLAALLASLDPRSSVDAASLKHIDEIVAANQPFKILEIVPDTAGASIGYYVDGQEPIANWKTLLAGMTTPAERSNYVNTLFTRLQSKGVLSNTNAAPLQYSYYDGVNHSFYTEAYTVNDPQNWQVLHLNTPETTTLVGTFSPQEGGPYRAAYLYSLANGGGYNQNIARFEYTETPVYGAGDYYYNPVFSELDKTTNFSLDWAKWSKTAVYQQDPDTGRYNYIATVSEIVDGGGFDAGETYYYVEASQTGAPGTNNYKAIVDTTDNDDAPQDGFVTASGTSYFSRTITGFSYVGTGGTYTYTASGSSSYTVYYPDVYYKAGFTSNNLMKQQVFGLDAMNYSALTINVTVKKASDVTSADVTGAGLIYLSKGTDITQSGVVTTYTAANDIPDAVAVQIFNYAASQNSSGETTTCQYPVIIDYALISGVTQSTPLSQLSRMQQLSLLCLQTSFNQTSATSLTTLTANWAAVWAKLTYVAADQDKTFVNNNVYCFDAFNTAALANPDNVTMLETPLFNAAYASAVVSSGFSAVLAEITNENFVRQLAGQTTLLPETVTVSASLRHIINYKGRRIMNAKTAIRVLDLEPAKVTASSWLTTDTVRAWINNTLPAESITIDHMTTAEFAGKITDINETYDMIYIGMSTETLNTSGGNTVYNDTAMNGLIYSNIGDKYYGNIELAGIRAQDYVFVNGTKAINNGTGTNANLFRFSGNDISSTAVTALQKYAQAGYPLILANGFVSNGAINTAKVDNSSYMYQAVSGVYGAFANVLKQDDAANNTSTVIKYLNVSKPSITLTTKPIDYTGTETMTPNPNDGYYYLRYDFTINNITDSTPVTTTYDCRLFMDLNADGRFAANEELGDIEVHRQADAALILPLTDESGNEYYALSANVSYSVTRQMSTGTVGIIPWKLEVVKNGADQIHASQQGFTRIAAGSSKQTVKVLQIMQAGTTGSKLNLQQQLTVNPSGTNPQLRGEDGSYYTGIYGKLIADLDDFAVNITTIETNTLEAKGSADTILGFLNDYDMLVIGFNDCYNGIGSNSASAIVDFISSGKSVLFTHDTTSLTQVPSSNYPMAISANPTTKTLNATDVLWNTSTHEYKSINGNIFWYGDQSATAPSNIRQYSPTYVVMMSSNVTSANEQDYYNARVNNNIYLLSGSSYSAIANPTSYNNFKNTTGTAPVIYVYCSDTSGWYGTGYYTDRMNASVTGNFTKFASGVKYTCSDLTYAYSNGNRPWSSYQNMTETSYSKIMMCLFNDAAPDSYTVIGSYDPSTNTYTLSGATWYPATGAPYPQTTLYSVDPDNPYTLSTLPNGITDWGYYFNTVIRDAVGLDRYGVTNSTLKSIVDVSSSMPWADITTVLAANRSVAFTPKSGRSTTVPEFQGYTNYAIIRFAGSGNTYNYTKNTYSTRETTKVSQVNQGQITTYPYNVNTLTFGGTDTSITSSGGSYMQIGNTHEQYFQINMNTDDIVVWYCLSSGTTNDSNYYYDDVPNDCANAYYIYNKGNVTYSGVGHSSDSSLYTGSNIGPQYVNEAKLFVNTMIAAYRSASQKPTVSFKKDANGTSDLTAVTVLVDEGKPSGADSTVVQGQLSASDEVRALYYRITDPNNTANKTITVQYFIADNTGTIDPDVDKTQKVRAITGVTTYYANGANVTSIKGGFVYKFFIPDSVYNVLTDDNVYSVRIYVKVTTTIGGEALASSDYIDIKKQQLFELS
ncbi:DUF5057 domain-containing protein [Oscillospiraceae bacterium CM]|nr:DUF5057 domain-containing protein [Oscillospiraceae bacterium CM]